MPVGRPIPPLELSDEVKKQLETMANSRSLPYAQVRRAQIILLSAKGLTNGAIPMGAVFVRKGIYDTFMQGPENAIELFHGFLFRTPGRLRGRAGGTGHL